MAHQHYKGTGQMHSFRGLLADGGQDKIRIEGATGEIAWRITKFQLFPNSPGNVTIESTMQIWREEQSSFSQVTDFNDNELLGAGYLHISQEGNDPAASTIIIFDNALFSRNIWVTHTELNGTAAANFYIELEEVKVSAAGMAQLAVAAARRT